MHTCRDDILTAFRSLRAQTGRDAFSPAEIVHYLQAQGTPYSVATIRTHIMARLCVNAPAGNFALSYPDLWRVGRGLYRLNEERSREAP